MIDLSRILLTTATASIAAWDAPAADRAALLAKCRAAAHAVAAVADVCAAGEPFPWDVAEQVRVLLGSLVCLNGADPDGDPCEIVDGRLVIGCPGMVERAAANCKHFAEGYLASRKATKAEWPLQRSFSGGGPKPPGGYSCFAVREEPEAEQRLRRLLVSDRTVVDWYTSRDVPWRGAYGTTEYTVRFTVGVETREDSEAGDAGGPGDSMVAQAARAVTGATEPAEVAQRLAGMMPTAMIAGHTKVAPGETLVVRLARGTYPEEAQRIHGALEGLPFRVMLLPPEMDASVGKPMLPAAPTLPRGTIEVTFAHDVPYVNAFVRIDASDPASLALVTVAYARATHVVLSTEVHDGYNSALLRAL